MDVYRLTFILIFVTAFTAVTFHRIRAYSQGGAVSQKEEGTALLVALRLGGLLLWGSFFIYMIVPRWLAWSSLDLPTWLRWSGAGLAVAGFLLAITGMLAIGKNVTKTVVTRGDHELIQHGPYRYIRNPLYTAGMMLFAGLGLLAANWFMLAGMLWAFILVTIRLPKEEQHLLDTFGDDYRQYRQRTGCYLPKVSS